MKLLQNFKLMLLMLLSTFVAGYAFAQDVIQPQDFLVQVIDFVRAFGGFSSMAKASGIILLLIASMKVTFLNQVIWSKLGAAQVWVAPVLGLIGGLVGLGSEGPVTWASVFAYLSMGAGAVVFHELLDSLKKIPGLGNIYVTVIDFIMSVLGAKKV